MDPERIVASFGLAEGMRVADFGSGAGYFTILSAKRVGESGVVTAVDIMDSSLETLRAKAKIEGLSNIQTVRSNLEVFGSSGLSDDSQDVVLLANILFQNPNKQSIVAEARRVLKPSGLLIVIDWRKGTGGFGPPEDLRTDEEEMKQLIQNSDSFRFQNQIDAGVFHYGMIFRKI
ncbi:MAG: class I SAM-dependent methyltransferase [Candidatus Yanofskybacteria bacterium]|nr:class I SAM-dependent methyltransferase [Candidatus Yanofskybacteria bacterium]